MAVRKKPKNDFGVELMAFCAAHGLTYRDVATGADVKRSTLIECTTGRCAGHELIPDVYKRQPPPLPAGLLRPPFPRAPGWFCKTVHTCYFTVYSLFCHPLRGRAVQLQLQRTGGRDLKNGNRLPAV